MSTGTRRGRRGSPEVKAARAATLLDNPEVRRVFDETTQAFFSEIERLELDGSEAAERRVIEAVRRLHALNEVKRTMLAPLVHQRILQEKKQRRQRA